MIKKIMLKNVVKTLLFVAIPTLLYSDSCNVGDSLWHIEDEIGQLLDDNAMAIQDFTNTTTALTQVLQEALIQKSRVDRLTTQLIDLQVTTTNNLAITEQLETDINQNFIQTFSLLEIIFQQSCTIDSTIDVLSNAIVITSTQIPPLFDKLCIIESQLESLEGIGANEFNEIAGTVTLLSVIDAKTTIILEDSIKVSQTSGTPITGTPSIVITAPGNYCLTGPVMGTITITVGDVRLDLNGYTVTIPAAQTGIQIQNNDGLSISIVNGSIDGQNSSTTGVSIMNTDFVALSDLIIYNCQTGITITQSVGCSVKNCTIYNVDAGIILASTQESLIQDTSIITGQSVGIRCFMPINNIGNEIFGCTITNLVSTGDSIGIHFSDGTFNLCQDCIINGISSNNASPSTIIAGILLDGTETLTKILNCQVSDVIALNAGPTSYGIINGPFTQTNQINSALVTGVTGNTDGIGFERLMTSTTQTTLFVKNIGFNNDINFGAGFDTTDVFEGGLNGIAGNLENISLPPF